MGLYVTLSINDSQLSSVIMLGDSFFVMLSVVMLSVVMLSVLVLSVVMLNIIMLSVVS
jgi:hypothetical protein